MNWTRFKWSLILYNYCCCYEVAPWISEKNKILQRIFVFKKEEGSDVEPLRVPGSVYILVISKPMSHESEWSHKTKIEKSRVRGQPARCTRSPSRCARPVPGRRDKGRTAGELESREWGSHAEQRRTQISRDRASERSDKTGRHATPNLLDAAPCYTSLRWAWHRLTLDCLTMWVAHGSVLDSARWL